MRKGKRQFIDHTNYFSPHFRKPRYKKTPEVKGSCGTYAVSVLLGKKPRACEELLGKDKLWNDLKMVRMLRSRGYTVLPLTINGVCGTTVESGKKFKLCGMHVVLCSQHAYSDEATYSVFYDGLQWHSGENGPTLPTEFINYPIWTCFLVWHPKWAPRTRLETHICRVYGNMESMFIEKIRENNPMGFKNYLKMVKKKERDNRKTYGKKGFYL